jgi:hypothetical protein
MLDRPEGYNLPPWEYVPQAPYFFQFRDGPYTQGTGVTDTLDDLARTIARFYIPPRLGNTLFYAIDSENQYLLYWHTDDRGRLDIGGISSMFEALQPHVADQILLLDLELEARGCSA